MTDLVDPDHLIIEPWPPRGAGGQTVGTSSGVQITHTLTGLVARCCSERSQHHNKQIAMDMILGGLTSPLLRWSTP